MARFLPMRYNARMLTPIPLDTAPNSEALLSASEVAAACGVSPGLARLWLRSGVLPSVVVGERTNGATRVARREDVERLRDRRAAAIEARRAAAVAATKAQAARKAI